LWFDRIELVLHELDRPDPIIEGEMIIFFDFTSLKNEFVYVFGDKIFEIFVDVLHGDKMRHDLVKEPVGIAIFLNTECF